MLAAPPVNYLSAAIRAKHVSVTITTDRAKATYILESTSSHMKSLGGKPSIIEDWTAPVLPQSVKAHDDASVRLVNVATGDVVFAYAVDRDNTVHGRQTAAESCARHLKVAIGTGGVSASTGNGPTLAAKMSAWPWRPDPSSAWLYYVPFGPARLQPARPSPGPRAFAFLSGDKGGVHHLRAAVRTIVKVAIVQRAPFAVPDCPDPELG